MYVFGTVCGNMLVVMRVERVGAVVAGDYNHNLCRHVIACHSYTIITSHDPHSIQRTYIILS